MTKKESQNIKAIVKYSVNVYFDEETDQYVGVCPELDYTGMGNTEEEAALNTDKAIKLALVWCAENDTLHDVLQESGYKKFVEPNSPPVWEHKPYIANFTRETFVA